jgi:hypothetical protein
MIVEKALGVCDRIARAARSSVHRLLNAKTAWRNRGLTDRAHPRRDPLVVALRAYRNAVADLNPAAVYVPVIAIGPRKPRVRGPVRSCLTPYPKGRAVLCASEIGAAPASRAARASLP